MNVKQVNAEERLVSVASSIEADPKAWKDWMALHVEGLNLKAGDFAPAEVTVKAIIEAYLQGIEGSAYICNGKDIYIICKNVSYDILKQTAAQIEDLAFAENLLECNCSIYELEADASLFAGRVFNNVGEKFSIRTSTAAPSETEVSRKKSSRSARGRTKVMLIEDDAVTRWMVNKALGEECEFAYAETASRAFSTYSAYGPDIVLLDIGLPDNSGRSVLEWIMRNDPAACVIMLSGKGNVDNIAGCIQTGAKGFIPKPFARDDILHYIRKYA